MLDFREQKCKTVPRCQGPFGNSTMVKNPILPSNSPGYSTLPSQYHFFKSPTDHTELNFSLLSQSKKTPVDQGSWRWGP